MKSIVCLKCGQAGRVTVADSGPGYFEFACGKCGKTFNDDDVRDASTHFEGWPGEAGQAAAGWRQLEDWCDEGFLLGEPKTDDSLPEVPPLPPI